MTTYRLTIRPAWSENVPAGYETLTPADDPKPGNYGTVTYAEPLPQERANHFSLIPVGPKITRLVVDGDVDMTNCGGIVQDTAYDFAVGRLDLASMTAAVLSYVLEYEVTLDVLEVDGRTIISGIPSSAE